MLMLITGGEASGKSAYAEAAACSLNTKKLFYIAIMKNDGAEAAARIEKHRERRREKNFITIERQNDLEDLIIPGRYDESLILLEDLGNLVANEQFDIGGSDDEITRRVSEGIESLCQKAKWVIVVGNEIFSEGSDYDAETLRYIRLLAGCTNMIAGLADSVTEVVCGIALPLKTEGPMEDDHGKEE